MRQYTPWVAGIVAAVLVIFMIARIRGGSGAGVTEREASRLLVCESCGTVSLLEPEFVRERYEAGEVRATGGEPRFKCPSCDELAARVEIMDFTTSVVRCEECGKDLIENEADAAKAVEAGDVQIGKDKQLQFRCSDCGEFHGRMVSREAPMDQE